MDRKKQQLGMNPSTASAKLIKDLLFDFVIKSGHKCFRCGGILTRDTFSIEHKVSWLNSDNPLKLFFDINNIAYSHLVCNVAASSGVKGKITIRKGRIAHGISGYRKMSCRCNICKTAYSKARKEKYTRLKT